MSTISVSERIEEVSLQIKARMAGYIMSFTVFLSAVAPDVWRKRAALEGAGRGDRAMRQR